MTAVLSRRAILKALGIAPAAAGMFAQQASAQAMRGIGLSALSGAAETTSQTANVVPFFSFMDWWQERGEENARRRAAEISGFDADILSLHVSLLAKVRMQRERNYRQLKAITEKDFLRRLTKFGKVEEWI